ncbi:MAG TPA: acyl-CoA thioester hydrolase/BAAT C-terminal domain-containing protein [Acidimicrobiales bacterium]|nr:acyl-CoA thioester hydrolase/BAAT C-terminal domain-containing protein [Acidimicrobiales bacterium]
MLVLAGSSGRVDEARARLLASRGVLAVAVRWFGGPGQPPGICEVPLETFTAVISELAASGARRIGILGLSKGAEAALLVATRDERVDAVVGVSPSAYAWANVGPGRDGRDRPQRSSWTWRGRPVPFVPYDDTWEPTGPPPVAYAGLYRTSLAAVGSPPALAAAAIDLDASAADVVLVAGGDDQLWPSESFARTLAASRRAGHPRPVRLVIEPAAGHRPVLPGEPAPSPSSERTYGGTPEADRALGRRAWPELLDVLLA